VTTWQEHEERTAAFFRNFGMRAETNKEVEGARAKHVIDVFVTFERAGAEQIWIVECKSWSRTVGGLHVLVLARVVNDIGADRGFLLTEAGAQADAIRVAKRRNITITGLKDLRAAGGGQPAEIAPHELERASRSQAKATAAVDYVRELAEHLQLSAPTGRNPERPPDRRPALGRDQRRGR
jgi:hypothetical protein